MMTDLLSNHLRDCGYDTFVANNSSEAAALLQKLPDLIILDINMPGTNGLELCKNIRNHIACPILFVTARITEQDKINLASNTAVMIISQKPFSLNELTARVAAHLRRDERGKNKPNILTSNELLVNLSERTVFL